MKTYHFNGFTEQANQVREQADRTVVVWDQTPLDLMERHSLCGVLRNLSPGVSHYFVMFNGLPWQH